MSYEVQTIPVMPALKTASPSAAFGGRALLLAIALGLGAALLLGPVAPARDLMALWLAAQEVAAGQPDAIYPPLAPVFEMRPPLSWYDAAAKLGRPGTVYPYLYPPLWAHLLAPVTGWIGFDSFARAVLGLHVALLALLPLIAAHFTLARAPTAAEARLWVGAAVAALILSHGVPVALLQGQPQILVAFLTLYGLDRAAQGRPVPGGLALGLAIALKLAPLPLALLWLLTGQSRAALVALGVTGALGLVSIALAGWPAHAEFWAQLRVIDHTALMSTSTAAFDTLWGKLCCLDQTQFIPALPPEIGTAGSGWHVLAKPAPWASAQKLALLGLLLALAVPLRRAPTSARRAALWGLACTCLAFLGPIGWIYYYIVPLALIAALPHSLGRAGWALTIGTIALLAAHRFMGFAGIDLPYAGLLPSLGVLPLAAGFAWAALPPAPENSNA
ncbi:glycosyltransferase 87 family protein [Rhodobacter sp. TJ_12]|uniref:glycosyltransferase 87 family protein n=1 Tax=Rhodobacter sp. TJ_12 TaxID=2029399 RepID=UPI001CC1AF80|nr:glycosyltransferase 87 family protein [Rhodobacter sp. TJ_12]